MKIYIPQDIDPAGKNYLLERGYELKMGTSIENDVMCREIADCDGIIIRVAKLSGEVIRSAPNLKVIARHGVGVDNIDVETASKLGIKVTNGPLSNSEAVAEQAVAFIMALGRRLFQMDQCVREGDWGARNRFRLMEFSGKTVGLIGFGRIARFAAKKLALGLDMKVITYGSHHTDGMPEYVQPVSSLEELLKQSDFVSIHCPLTEKTRGMLGIEQFRMMKPTAYLINTARGEVICEEDLYKAISEGVIAGAALDVVTGEVIQKDNPLLNCKNIIFSPHCASHTNESFANMALHAAMGIDEVLSGKKVTWPV